MSRDRGRIVRRGCYTMHLTPIRSLSSSVRVVFSELQTPLGNLKTRAGYKLELLQRT